MGGLLRRIADGTISGKIAKDVFDAMWCKEAEGPDAAASVCDEAPWRLYAPGEEL